MNSTQLHYREATSALQAADAYRLNGNHEVENALVARAHVHALLAATTAIVELARQADPATVNVHLEGTADPTAVARAVGVYRAAADNIIHHHAFNAFGSPT